MGHYTTEQKPYALALSCYNKKKNIFRRHSIDASILHGLLTELRSSKEAQPRKEVTPHKLDKTTLASKNHTMVIPYYRGLSESLKKICSRHGVQVYFKGGNTIKNLLMAPKDKDPIMKKSGVIYRYRCNRLDCDEEYIGESSRVFGEKFKEHQKAPSPIFDHTNTSGHNINIENLSIVGRGGPEPQKSNKRSTIHKGQ